MDDIEFPTLIAILVGIQVFLIVSWAVVKILKIDDKPDSE